VSKDGGLIFADIYGKMSAAWRWCTADLYQRELGAAGASAGEKAGFHVFAIDMRSYGHSRGPRQAIFTRRR